MGPARRLILILGLGMSSCVGQPPSPPAQAGSGSVDGGTVASSGSSSTSAADAEPTSSGSSGGSTDGGGSSGSSGSSSSTGEPVPTLVDVGLVGRWYLDEAEEGQRPAFASDAAPDPVDLALSYLEGVPTYAEIAGNRALSWASAGLSGRAEAPVEGSKLEATLAGVTAATFEVVVSVDAVTNNRSRLIHIGPGPNMGDVSIGAETMDRLDVTWQNSTVRTYPLELTGERQIVHLVIDTGQAAADQRLMLHLDGVPVAPIVLDDRPGLGEPLVPSPDAWFVLGNRTIGNRSFGGQLYYAAVYDAALSAVEIAQNVAVLLVDDDTP